MRTLQQARQSWQVLQPLTTTRQFKQSLAGVDETGALQSRSIHWKLFLLFESADHSQWLRRLGDSRSAYVSLRGHLLRAIDHPDEVDTGEDPLSEDAKSQWEALRQDEGLRQEILQDVDRCMPEHAYFREAQTHAMMLDVLFIFCKLNPDVSYRQGMHELLAPILWVIQCDAIEGNGSDTPSDDFLLCQLCDARFIEHDAFTLFSLVMQNAKTFYEQKAHSRLASHGSKHAPDRLENPILTIINRIYDDYLPRLDPQLSDHLHAIDLIPQVFLMRWIRLLFGREFPFDHVLPVWDVLLSEDPGLDSVEMMCIVMLARIRFDLLDADHNEALTLLLRYPPLPDGVLPRDLAVDAVALKRSFTPALLADLVQKYTGRRPDLASTLPDPDDFAIADDMDSKAVAVRPSPRNLENIFQDAAKNVFTQGEKWGINKAFRDAVDEVRRGVKDIQNMPTPQAPRRHGRLQSRSSISSNNGAAAARRPELELKLARQQQRNERLADMLKQATAQLWECQRALADLQGVEADDVRALSVGIARVGFVQVYLEDPSIPLPPPDDDDDDAAGETAATAAEPRDTAPSQARPPPAATTPPPTAPPAAQATPFDPHTSRPTLAQSSFSWMLGQDAPVDTGAAAAPSSAAAVDPSPGAAAARPRGRGFLFGDDDGVAPGGADAGLGTPTKRRGKGRVVRRGGGGAGQVVEGREEEDGFDLSDLRRG